MNNTLTNTNLSVSVPGKIILIGEHSVVYGHPALAVPLHNVTLTLTICHNEPQENWESAWKVQIQKKDFELKSHFKHLLTQSLELALKLFGKNISDFAPQRIFIDSEIPLGGGMGGSAAISASFIKLCQKIFSCKISLEQEIEFANQIDSLFHSGRASGLDVTTILCGKPIQFQKGVPFKPIQSGCEFFIALVDSGERTETCVMIRDVALALEKQDKKAQNAIKHLGSLALECENYLTQGDLIKFAQNLNLAQEELINLGVSTPTLNTLCQNLIQQGALCAKLTGAGGGGLVMGLFKEDPKFLYNIYGNDKVFITKITS